jgi:hypothetical protein
MATQISSTTPKNSRKSQKELKAAPMSSSLTTIMSDLFSGPDMDIVKVLVDESRLENYPHPIFSGETAYQKKIEDLTLTIKENLSMLKSSCFEVNWLDDYTEMLSENSTSKSGESLSEFDQKKPAQKRRRRACPDMDRSNVCPYKNCVKAYTSKTSLRFHIKRHHLADDELKPVVAEPSKGPIKFRRGVNLRNVFKKEHLSKLESKLGYAHCSTEDYSNSITSGEIYENSIQSETLLEEQTNQTFSDRQSQVSPDANHNSILHPNAIPTRQGLVQAFPSNKLILSKEDKELHKEIFQNEDKKSQVSTDCFGVNEITYHENFDDLDIALKNSHFLTNEDNTFYDLLDDLVFSDTPKGCRNDFAQDLFGGHHYRTQSMYEPGFGELDNSPEDDLTKISLGRPISLSFDYY